jgi:hypothetical protein
MINSVIKGDIYQIELRGFVRPSIHPSVRPYVVCIGNGQPSLKHKSPALHRLFQYPFRYHIKFISNGAGLAQAVSIVSDYGLDDRAIGVRSPARAKDFSSILWVQTGSGAHPASCPMGTGGSFPGGKARPGRDADHLPHLVPRSWMSRSYTFTPPSASMACNGTAILLFYLLLVHFKYSTFKYFWSDH